MFKAFISQQWQWPITPEADNIGVPNDRDVTIIKLNTLKLNNSANASALFLLFTLFGHNITGWEKLYR